MVGQSGLTLNAESQSVIPRNRGVGKIVTGIVIAAVTDTPEDTNRGLGGEGSYAKQQDNNGGFHDTPF